MQSYISLIIAIYGAVVSSFTAFKWWIESRPYLEIKKSPKNLSGALLVAIHNPGRRPVFIVDSTIPKRQRTGTNQLLNILPYREEGITDDDEIATMFSRDFWFLAPPGGRVLILISPIHEITDAIVILDWHRGWILWPIFQRLRQKIANPLKIPVTYKLVDTINNRAF